MNSTFVITLGDAIITVMVIIAGLLFGYGLVTNLLKGKPK